MAIERAIFDMDLTLYRQKDPEHAQRVSFYETRLGVMVTEQILCLVTETENVPLEKAQCLLDESKADPVGPSVFFAERYGLTRLEYFEQTWGRMDPRRLIDKKDIDAAGQVLEATRALDIEPVLLTMAPTPWAERVLKVLKVDSFFDTRIYGEQFEHKREVFPTLVVGRLAAAHISIGDDIKHDIEPAQELGMHTYHVHEDNPLSGLPQFLSRHFD